MPPKDAKTKNRRRRKSVAPATAHAPALAISRAGRRWADFCADPDGPSNTTDHVIILGTRLPEAIIPPDGCALPQTTFTLQGSRDISIAPGETLFYTTDVHYASASQDPGWRIGSYWRYAGDTTAPEIRTHRMDLPVHLYGPFWYDQFMAAQPADSATLEGGVSAQSINAKIDAGYLRATFNHSEDDNLAMQGGVSRCGDKHPTIQALRSGEYYDLNQLDGLTVDQFFANCDTTAKYIGSEYDNGFKVRMDPTIAPPAEFTPVSGYRIYDTGQLSLHTMRAFGLTNDQDSSLACFSITNNGAVAKTVTVEVLIRARATGSQTFTEIAATSPTFNAALQVATQAPSFAGPNSFLGFLGGLAKTLLPGVGTIVSSLIGKGASRAQEHVTRVTTRR